MTKRATNSDVADEAEHDHPRLDALKEKSQKEKVVRGRTMSAGDIFKFAGLAVFLVLMVVIGVLIWPYIKEIFEPGGIERVMEKVQNAGPGGVAILLAIQFLQIVVAFIPGEVVQVAAGMLYGPWLGALVVLVGCVISSAFIFVVVHKLGAPFVQDMVPTKYLDKFRKFEASGKLNPLVFVLFLIPGLPKDVFTYLVPLTDMRMRTFLLLSNIGRIPGIVVSTYAAAGIVEGDYVQSAILFAVTAAVAAVGMLCYERVMRWYETRTAAKGKELKRADALVVLPNAKEALDPEDYATRNSGVIAKKGEIK